LEIETRLQNRVSIGNGTWGIKWSRDRKRHVILTGRGRDTNMLGAHYLNFDWRFTLSLWLLVTLNF